MRKEQIEININELNLAFKEIRKAKRLTQNEVKELCNYSSKQLVSNIETGHKVISIKHIYKLVQKLGGTIKIIINI